MDKKAVYLRTSRGENEVSGKTANLYSAIRRVLVMVDGVATFSEIYNRAAPSMRKTLDEMFDELEKGGYIQNAAKESYATGMATAPKMSIPSKLVTPLKTPQKKDLRQEEGDDLDFMGSASPKKPTQDDRPKRTPAEEEAARLRVKQEADAILQKAANEAARVREEAEREKKAADNAAREEAERRAKEEKEAARIKAEQEAEAAKLKAKQEAEAILRKAEQEAARIREEAERERRRIEEEAAAREEKERRAKEEAEAARLKAEQEAAERLAEAAREEQAAEAARREAEHAAAVAREVALRIAMQEREAAKARREEEARLQQQAEAARKEAERAAIVAQEKAESLARKEQEAARVRKEVEEKAKRQEAESKTVPEPQSTSEFKLDAFDFGPDKGATPASPAASSNEKSSLFESSLKLDAFTFDTPKVEPKRPAVPDMEQVRKQEEQIRASEAIDTEAEALAYSMAEAKKAEQEAKAKAEAKAKEEAKAKAKAKAKAEAESKAKEEAKAKAEAQGKAEAKTKAEAGKREEKVFKSREEIEKSEAEALKGRLGDVTFQDAGTSAYSQAIRPSAIRKTRRSSFPLGMLLIVILILCVGALFIVPYVLPMRDYMPKVAQYLSAELQQPVHIGQIGGRILPTPRLDLGEIYIGDVKQLQVNQAQIYFSIPGLLADNKPIDNIDLQGVKVTGTGLQAATAWLQNIASDKTYPVQRMSVNQGELDADFIKFTGIDGELVFNQAGTFSRANLRGNGGKISLGISVGQEKVLQVDLSMRDHALPLLPKWIFDELTAKGELTRKGMKFSEYSGRILDGIVKGDASIEWGSSWRAQGTMRAQTFAMEKMSKGLSGEMEGSARFHMLGTNLSMLADSAMLDGTFTVQEGVINGIDFVETALLRSKESAPGGRTKFDKLTGTLSTSEDGIAIRQLRMEAGDMIVSGTIDIDKQQLSGKIMTDLSKMPGKGGKFNMTVGGTTDNPVLRDTH